MGRARRLNHLGQQMLAGLGLCCALLASAASDLPENAGLLWAISGPGHTHNSYLFGTMHLGDARLQPQIELAKSALAHTRSLVLEVDPGSATQAHLLQSGMHSCPTPMTQRLGKKMTAQLQKTLRQRGLPSSSIDRMELWLVFLLLQMPEQASTSVDLSLHQHAQQQAWPVAGLETAQEQLAALQGLPQDALKTLIQYLLEHPEQSRLQLESLMSAYAAGDLNHLVTIANDRDNWPAAPKTRQLVEDQLIHQRDQRMLERLLPLLKQGPQLIAVGALHLPGLLRGLQQQGLSLTPIHTPLPPP